MQASREIPGPQIVPSYRQPSQLLQPLKAERERRHNNERTGLIHRFDIGADEALFCRVLAQRGACPGHGKVERSVIAIERTRKINRVATAPFGVLGQTDYERRDSPDTQLSAQSECFVNPLQCVSLTVCRQYLRITAFDSKHDRVATRLLHLEENLFVHHVDTRITDPLEFEALLQHRLA